MHCALIIRHNSAYSLAIQINRQVIMLSRLMHQALYGYALVTRAIAKNKGLELITIDKVSRLVKGTLKVVN